MITLKETFKALAKAKDKLAKETDMRMHRARIDANYRKASTATTQRMDSVK